MIDIENQNIELDLLLEAIYQKYGYDFRGYARAHLKRRIMHRLGLARLDNILELTHGILHDQSFFETLLLDFSINVTEMFRDPQVYLALRQVVIPALKEHPFLKIWHAGCSTGEEVYSMAIILQEEGLYNRTQIYATDLNEVVLQKASQGIYPIKAVRKHTQNYQKAGGKRSFADYYSAKYDSVIFDKSLKERIVFADHNLVTDRVFGEMNLILCRNVLIYFSRPLQNRVIRLFHDSLCPDGFLCLGVKESIRFSECASHFDVVADKEKIYRKDYQ